MITYLSPGLRFFHEGQFEGRRKRISPHLVRAPHEPVDEVLQVFYKDLLAVLRCPAVVHGEWRLLSVRRPGGQLDVGLLRRLGLAGEQRRPADADRRQLRRKSKPMLRPTATD